MTHALSAPSKAGHQDQPRRGPLDGVRIVDLTTVVMGPFATQILGDLGADVIKVEAPGGDSLRGIGPWRSERMGPLYLQNNRNKRGVQLDLKVGQDMERLLALVADADVLVSNIRPQAMARLGLDYATLSAVNPRIILARAVGYGSGGRRSGQAVYDDLMQADAGIAGLFQAVDGTPRYAPINLGDRTVALYIVMAITAALYDRERTGAGQDIEIPMFETMAQFVLADHLGGAAFVPPLGEMGYRRLLSAHRGPYPTKDSFITLVIYTNDQWRRFLPLIGAEGLLESDPRFADQHARVVHADDVGRFLAERLRDRTTGEWLEALAAVDIPATRVNSLEDLLEDPHLQDVGFFCTYDHPTEGRILTTRPPVKFGSYRHADPLPPPRTGAHNDEVFGSANDAHRA